MMRRHLPLSLVAALAQVLQPTAGLAQGGFLVTGHPAYTRVLDVDKGTLGGWLNVLIVRTKNVAVGPEVGYFDLGTASDSFAYWDPTHDVISLEEKRARSFWFLAATSRYEMPGAARIEPYFELGTGLYRISESLLTTARLANGQDVSFPNPGVRKSRSMHPGVSVGLGAQLGMPPRRIIGIELEVRAHSILGVGGGLIPVIALSVGLYRWEG
ncbi:MAG: hypothetical protein P8X82_06560 [Gemmatimonadales bacterium]